MRRKTLYKLGIRIKQNNVTCLHESSCAKHLSRTKLPTSLNFNLQTINSINHKYIQIYLWLISFKLIVGDPKYKTNNTEMRYVPKIRSTIGGETSLVRYRKRSTSFNTWISRKYRNIHILHILIHVVPFSNCECRFVEIRVVLARIYGAYVLLCSYRWN